MAGMQVSIWQRFHAKWYGMVDALLAGDAREAGPILAHANRIVWAVRIGLKSRTVAPCHQVHGLKRARGVLGQYI